ncbi:MAG: DUF3316 domain-containing protein [Muribaculaceae bacterium]|nr:DUF3316 domain-containing protein [Muribaculaceae bacterium]
MFRSGAARAGEADSVQLLRPVNAMFTAEVGHARVLDTYLTPIAYSGTHLALGYTATQATGFAPHRWTRQLSLEASYAPARNPAHNRTLHTLMAEGGWSLMHRWPGWRPGVNVLLGGSTRLRAGAVYNPSGSNNVVSAHIHWSVGAAGMIVWSTRLRRVPVTLSYSMTLPVAGVFFSPEYDESFYEIYLGNHSHLAHFGWWGNRFDLDHRLSLDLHLGGTIVRVGYHGRFEQSWVSHLDTKFSTHALVIGIGGDFLSIPRRGINPKAKIINGL